MYNLTRIGLLHDDYKPVVRMLSVDYSTYLLPHTSWLDMTAAPGSFRWRLCYCYADDASAPSGL